MSDVKYQIFVSSTFADLVAERLAISRAILDMGHIPAGMEMFPAADTEQLSYIRKVIDECDYYILIIGARYGSTDEQGVSFTEREYEYAVGSGKPVLAFIHESMDEIPLGKTDKDAAKLDKLIEFRNKVSEGRLVRFWKNQDELASQAILSLTRTFSSNPQIGWIRANKIPSESTLSDVLKYRSESDNLRKEIDRMKKEFAPKFEDAAGLDLEVNIPYSYQTTHGRATSSKDIRYSEFLRLAAPQLHTPSSLAGVRNKVEKGLIERMVHLVAF